MPRSSPTPPDGSTSRPQGKRPPGRPRRVAQDVETPVGARIVRASPPTPNPEHPDEVRPPENRCPACLGAVHRHVSGAWADHQCWWRQFSEQIRKHEYPRPPGIEIGTVYGGTIVTVIPTPTSYLAFAGWLAQGHAKPRPGRYDDGHYDDGLRVRFD